jgi:hypothetical protein
MTSTFRFSCLAYSSTLKMEATRSSETSVDFYRTTWRYIPEDRTLHNYICETLNPTNIYIKVLQPSNFDIRDNGTRPRIEEHLNT